MATFTLHDLEKRVQERAKASAEVSYTRKLIDRGVAIAPRSSARRPSRQRSPRSARIAIA